MQKKTVLDRIGQNLLKHYDPKDTDIVAQEICLAIRAAKTPRQIDEAMSRINTLMHGYGVEVCRQRNSQIYWGDTGLLYVNYGDTYIPTIIYDTHKERAFSIWSWVPRPSAPSLTGL